MKRVTMFLAALVLAAPALAQQPAPAPAMPPAGQAPAGPPAGAPGGRQGGQPQVPPIDVPWNDAIPAGTADHAARALKESTRHGEWVDIKLADGTALKSWVVYPESATKTGVVLVIHDINGMRDLPRAVGDQLTCVFVDHGLMRKNEGEQVISAFRDTFKVPLVAVDAADRFLGAIARRDSWSESLIVLLGDRSTPSFQAFVKGWHAVPCWEGLAVSTVVPGWGFGWSTIFEDEYVYKVSFTAGALRPSVRPSFARGKGADDRLGARGVILHPFGSEMHCRRYGPAVASPPPKRALATAVKDSVIRWAGIENASCSRSRWTRPGPRRTRWTGIRRHLIPGFAPTLAPTRHVN
jgi:hypothetical protein